MIRLTTRSGQRLALFGLGGSGRKTAESLIAGGADVVAFDDNPEQVAAAAASGIPTGDLRDLDWSTVSALVLAPGVPLTHPEPHWSVGLAEAAGVSIVGDIGLFSDELEASGANAPFIAITGTNGKSTTTALIAHVLAHAGRAVAMGGNIGTPVLELEPPRDGLHYVVECSSYQIDLAPGLRPTVGILTNLTPDHLDRHGTMEHYAAVKRRLIEGAATAVVGIDDEWCRAIADAVEKRGRNVIRISAENPAADIVLQDGAIVRGRDTEIADLSGTLTLRGAHNAQNAAAAAAALLSVGLAAEEIAAGFRTFPGLVHRMQPLGRVGRTVFVNDSKATNADATAHALASFTDIFWIAGGRAKSGGIDSLNRLFPRICKAYLIGEAAGTFAATLGEVPHEIAETLDAAVSAAARDATASGKAAPVVLLSPACASFDQYRNFEVRGDAFAALVRDLPGFDGSLE